jgi:hypothetical protein
MSNTLMVWKPQPDLTRANAHETYRKIAEGEIILEHDPSLDLFLQDLLLEHPKLEDLKEDEYSPWSVTPEVFEGHVALGISGDMINTSTDVLMHAVKYDLVVYDPQIDVLMDSSWTTEIK